MTAAEAVFELVYPLPDLEQPRLLIALQPWIDVGSVGTMTLGFLEQQWNALEQIYVETHKPPTEARPGIAEQQEQHGAYPAPGKSDASQQERPPCSAQQKRDDIEQCQCDHQRRPTNSRRPARSNIHRKDMAINR